MNGGIRRRLAVVAVTLVGVGALAGTAWAGSSFQLSVTPTHVKPGGTVTISTTPRMACTLTVTIAKKAFSHVMKTGWTQITMPRADGTGRVPVKVSCGGHVVTSSFTVEK